MSLPPATPIATPTPAPPTPRQGRLFLPMFIAAWFGINIATSAVVGAAIPKTFAFLGDATKEVDLSIVTAIGGIVVIVITPLFGRLSDRTMSRFGMRRPWIVAGAVIGFVGVVVLAFSSTLWPIVLGWAIVQAGFGAANAAVHALLAEQIPTRIRARVAGLASASGSVALIAGTQIIAALPNDARWLWFMVPGTIGAVLTGALAFGLRDIVRTTRPPSLDWRAIVSTYWLSPRDSPDFLWAFLCRMFVTMSVFTVATYLLFFIIDRLGVPKEEASGVQATALVVFTIGGLLTNVLFGWISDRTGRRKTIVWISCACSVAGLLVAMFAPDTSIFLVGLALVGAAQGAYVSVDIALKTEVLPHHRDAGKDLGIVALSYQVPQLVSPIIAVPLLAIGGSGANYTALFAGAIVFGVLGGLAVLPIRSVK
ncbi:MFS transporter [Pseudoclavibacter chungangensis]|uniref:MFS transporter n=1 Tax=Pseudoclavibacter chungangensis TaxID=587635 RepID=A0A7J5BQ89_9MICO|nr:MFS transporter [Pseudoclavibacter chungangensis]KAB1655952.1 MFS transporter [Pseudoclavibacter chungangensis]NYJ66396.1 MFS family permease [Pseudoclavibacter chungangensis]